MDRLLLYRQIQQCRIIRSDQLNVHVVSRVEKCYAILETVPTAQHPEFEAKFASCRWFTRGWTFQELLAPEIVEFFGHDDSGSWSYLGDRVSLEGLISITTSISRDYLRHERAVSTASIAERMCWAANRQTTREEDIAYCLLGLFSVNMPMLYGEGSRAFLRLQEEILKNSDDQSIFAWTTSMANQPGIEDPQVSLDMVELIENNFYVVGKGPGRGNHHGLLADDPTAFARSGRVVRMQNEAFSVFQMTNRGLRISLPLASVYGLDDLGRNAQKWGARIALLQCRQADGDRRQLGVYLRGVATSQQASIGQFARVGIGKLAAIGAGAEKHRLEETELFVSQMPLHRPSHHRSAFCLLHRLDGTYRATRVETLDVSDGEDLLDRYPSETVSARSWVPTEFPTVFRIPNADQAFLKIRLENEKERDWVEILIGGNCKDSKTIWGEMSSNARLSEPQKGRFVSQKAYGSDNSDRVQLVEREHADGERKLFLLDIKVGFEARKMSCPSRKMTVGSPKSEPLGTCTLGLELIRSLRTC